MSSEDEYFDFGFGHSWFAVPGTEREEDKTSSDVPCGLDRDNLIRGI